MPSAAWLGADRAARTEHDLRLGANRLPAISYHNLEGGRGEFKVVVLLRALGAQPPPLAAARCRCSMPER